MSLRNPIQRMKNIAKLTGIASALLVAGSSLAFADSHGKKAEATSHHHDRHMRLLDTDNDGQISLEEVAAEYGRLVALADIDGDGALSPDEFRRRGRMFMQLRVYTLFDLLDSDGDQKVSATELTAPSGRMFKRYDADNSGSLSVEEMPKRMHHKRHLRHKK